MTKHWTFSEKAHIGKFRNSWNEITEKYIFFPFPTVCIFYFCKNINPRLYVLFLVDKSIKIINMFWELLEAFIKSRSFFRNKILIQWKNTEIRCHIYILMKKVIILGKIHEPLWKWSLSHHHKKKLKIFTLQRLIYYVQY